MPEIDYSMEAVPTYYNGITYRSRLEARWAAFFTLCRWRFEYEPADFNGWFPDFVLLAEGGIRVFVEVKPIGERCLELEQRIDRSGCQEECLILGLSPLAVLESWSNGSAIYRLGWLRERVIPDGLIAGGFVALNKGQGESGWFWDSAELCQLKLSIPRDLPDVSQCELQAKELLAKYELDFCHSSGDWTARISRLYDKHYHIAPIQGGRLHELWGLAHDMTRYDPF